jgi:hypothetical protein
MYFCCLDRGKLRYRNSIAHFKYKRLMATVQEAELLAQELGSTELENKKLDEEAERLLVSM